MILNTRDILLSSIIIFLAAVAVYLRVPGGRLWKTFQKSAAKSIAETRVLEQRVITQEQVSDLPEPLQRYFKLCGYPGKPAISNACVIFREVPFTLQRTMQISYQQYNSIEQPNRVAFVNGTMFGIPFQGMDYFIKGEGYFTGVLAKHIPVVHSSGSSEEMQRSFLLTFLGDASIMPSIFLADYVTCTELDSRSVKVEISYYGVQAEGIFNFNDEGEIIRFTCEDRLYDDGQGEPYPARWILEIGDYRMDEAIGVRRPYRVKVFWDLPEGEFVYFSCDHFTIAYNMDAPTAKMVRP